MELKIRTILSISGRKCRRQTRIYRMVNMAEWKIKSRFYEEHPDETPVKVVQESCKEGYQEDTKKVPRRE
jgi:hypothetical protein